MIKVYKYTIIVVSFIMFFTFVLFNAFENDISPVYADYTKSAIQYEEVI